MNLPGESSFVDDLQAGSQPVKFEGEDVRNFREGIEVV